MPYAAKVVPLMLELLYLGHFGKPLDARHERVGDRPAHRARKRHEPRRVELLVAEEYDLVFEEDAAYCSDDLIRQLSEVYSQKLCAERAGDAPHFHLRTFRGTRRRP